MGVAHVRGMGAQEPCWGRDHVAHSVRCAVRERAGVGGSVCCVRRERRPPSLGMRS